MPRGQFIDIIQTAGILFMSILLGYVVMRLERALNVGAEKLKEVGAHNQATLDSLNKLWTRINEIEHRMGVRNADSVPTPDLRKALKAIEINTKRLDALERIDSHESASHDN